MKRERNQDVENLLNGEEVVLPSEEEMNHFREREGLPPINASLHIGLLQMEENENN